MTTPGAMSALIERLQAKFDQAHQDWAILPDDDPSSAYATGYRDAIGEILEDITGEPTQPSK